VRNLVLVGAGGFLGAASRYLVTTSVLKLTASSAIPVANLTVNLVGCAMIGLLTGLADGRGVLGPDLRLFLIVGVLGGFTTYSSFGLEAFELLRRGSVAPLLLYLGAHLLLGVAAVAGGYKLGHGF
jgi:CrcB protein